MDAPILLLLLSLIAAAGFLLLPIHSALAFLARNPHPILASRHRRLFARNSLLPTLRSLGRSFLFDTKPSPRTHRNSPEQSLKLSSRANLHAHAVAPSPLAPNSLHQSGVTSSNSRQQVTPAPRNSFASSLRSSSTRRLESSLAPFDNSFDNSQDSLPAHLPPRSTPERTLTAGLRVRASHSQSHLTTQPTRRT